MCSHSQQLPDGKAAGAQEHAPGNFAQLAVDRAHVLEQLPKVKAVAAHGLVPNPDGANGMRYVTP